MREKTTESVATRSPTWETLETFARQTVQQFLQFDETTDNVYAHPRGMASQGADPRAPAPSPPRSEMIPELASDRSCRTA